MLLKYPPLHNKIGLGLIIILAVVLIFTVQKQVKLSIKPDLEVKTEIKPQSTVIIDPAPWPTPSDEPEIYLYHYTLAENIPNIIATGLKPSIRFADTPTSDAQWGDGQYFTDLTPMEATTLTRQQFSYTLFKHPWKFGAPPASLKTIGWLKINVNKLNIGRESSLFGNRFSHRSIYRHASTLSLPVADRLAGTGVITFQPGPTGQQ